MIDYFTKEQFEGALPRHKETKQILWKSEGLVQGEYCYSVKIDDKSKILIRSSIGPSGKSADIGEDSIRTFLVDNENKNLGSKISKWTTRKPGWQDRMLSNCRYIIKLRRAAGDNEGGIPKRILKVKIDGPNKGRFFISEPMFNWLTDEQGHIIKKPV